jgi:hypothetical protein
MEKGERSSFAGAKLVAWIALAAIDVKLKKGPQPTTVHADPAACSETAQA